MVYQFGIMSVDNSLNNELFNKLKDAILPPINDISNNSMAEKQKIYNDHIQYQDDIAKNLSQFIIQESVKFGIPYSCKDSKLNRNGFQKSYIKFVCKFHTHKRNYTHTHTQSYMK